MVCSCDVPTVLLDKSLAGTLELLRPLTQQRDSLPRQPRATPAVLGLDLPNTCPRGPRHKAPTSNGLDGGPLCELEPAAKLPFAATEFANLVACVNCEPTRTYLYLLSLAWTPH